MFEIMLAMLLAVASAMPKNMVSNTNDTTILAQDSVGDGIHIPPGTPPLPYPIP
jgi:hypothetical protein